MRQKYVFLLFVLAFGVFLPSTVFSHGVDVYNVSSEKQAVQTVYFRYSTGEPVSFAKVKLFPPSMAEKNIESLVSITDRNGLYSFVPDEDGAWRVDVEDGMGHAASISIALNASEKNAAPAAADKKLPLTISAILGLSLILNVFAVWYFIARLKRGR
ncbi:hypothetical protein AGMMS50212_02850 [Spirochaetia bacterium]|nr:hypothetical protein AGMMS50212_02850 [Spirochaetia bacterium]